MYTFIVRENWKTRTYDVLSQQPTYCPLLFCTCVKMMMFRCFLTWVLSPIEPTNESNSEDKVNMFAGLGKFSSDEGISLRATERMELFVQRSNVHAGTGVKLATLMLNRGNDLEHPC